MYERVTFLVVAVNRFRTRQSLTFDCSQNKEGLKASNVTDVQYGGARDLRIFPWIRRQQVPPNFAKYLSDCMMLNPRRPRFWQAWCVFHRFGVVVCLPSQTFVYITAFGCCWLTELKSIKQKWAALNIDTKCCEYPIGYEVGTRGPHGHIVFRFCHANQVCCFPALFTILPLTCHIFCFNKYATQTICTVF
jgi:hypothetical protein